MDHRALPQDLHMHSSAPFGVPYTYPFTLDEEIVLQPMFWAGLRARLRPGDTLRLVQLTQDKKAVRKVFDTLVVKSEPEGVELLVTDRYDLSATGLERLEGQAAEVLDDVQVKWIVGLKQYALNKNGERIGLYADRAEADAAAECIRRGEPLPTPVELEAA